MDAQKLRHVINEAFDKAQTNHKKLKSCARHKFTSVNSDSVVFNREHSCILCGGTMKERDVLIYCSGYAAAGGNPDDIYPGILI